MVRDLISENRLKKKPLKINILLSEWEAQECLWLCPCYLQCERLDLDPPYARQALSTEFSTTFCSGRQGREEHWTPVSAAHPFVLLRRPPSQAVSFLYLEAPSICWEMFGRQLYERPGHTCLVVRRKEHLQALLLPMQTSDKWSSTTQGIASYSQYHPHQLLSRGQWANISSRSAPVDFFPPL